MTDHNRPEAWNQFLAIAPYTGLLGMEAVSASDSGCVIALPYRDDLVGDPDSGVLHGGAITALMDVCFGFSVYFRTRKFVPMATLDLRIDYMRPAEKGRDILAEAECYHTTRNVAFTRAWAFHESREKVIATAAGAFALNDISRWASGNEAVEYARKMLSETSS